MDFSGLTDTCKLALARARNEALFFQQDRIQPEHILAALAGLPKCLAFSLLCDLNIYMHLLMREVVMVAKFGQTAQFPPNPDFSCVSLRVLERAEEEARALGTRRIGTEHLLLGLLGEKSQASYVLADRLDIQVDEVRSMVRATADGNGDGGQQTDS